MEATGYQDAACKSDGTSDPGKLSIEFCQEYPCNTSLSYSFLSQTIWSTWSDPLSNNTLVSREMLHLRLLFEVRSLGRIGRLLCHLSLSISRGLLDLVSLVGKVEGLYVSRVIQRMIETYKEVGDHLRPGRGHHEPNVAVVPADNQQHPPE